MANDRRSRVTADGRESAKTRSKEMARRAENATAPRTKSELLVTALISWRARSLASADLGSTRWKKPENLKHAPRRF